MLFLRQSTAVDVAIGPFLNDTDGFTAETGLTIAQADVRLKKNDANWGQKNQSSSATHEENGWYEISLNTTDTNTLGILMLAITKSGALPVWVEYMVVPANVYDSLFSTDKLQVDVAQFGDTNLTASGGRPEVNTTLIEGSGATNQIRDSVVDDATRIDASALNTLSGHDPGETIMGATDLGTGAGLTSLASATGLATVAGYIDTEVAAILADTNELQTDWANGGRLDLLIDAIKAKTDNLPSDPASQSSVDGLPTELLDTDIEADWTLKDHFRISAAALYGKTSGYGTGTVVHRDVNDEIDRIEATAEDGNRSVVTLDASDP